jgi:hypothetical protein
MKILSEMGRFGKFFRLAKEETLISANRCGSRRLMPTQWADDAAVDDEELAVLEFGVWCPGFSWWCVSGPSEGGTPMGAFEFVQDG